MGNDRIRLWGIDAPEMSQTCGDLPAGRLAAGYLAELIGGQPVTGATPQTMVLTGTSKNSAVAFVA